MKRFDVTRPDKLLLAGLRTIGSYSRSLYAHEKADAKAKAELTFFGEKHLEEVETQLFTYNEKECTRIDNTTTFDFQSKSGEDLRHWLNFHGIHEVPLIEDAGQAVPLDRLTIRQILDTTQRPKVEEYDEYLFFNIKSILSTEDEDAHVEHLSFVLGDSMVISFQEEKGDHFETIRTKMSEGVGFIRQRSSDYLLSQLIDAILDNYFETLEKFREKLEQLAVEVISSPTNTTLLSLETFKRNAQIVKKSLTPLREALNTLLEDRPKFIREENLKFFRDLYHSTNGALDEIDETQKSVESLTNIYFANLSQKMNETMKVLTTVATLFIPLTFIAGIYGMNFEYMPELQYRYGYFVTWGVMVLTTLGMLWYFRRRKWM